MDNTNIKEIYKKTEQHYIRARKAVDAIEKRAMLETYHPISDMFPSFPANKLEFGSFNQKEYAVLFVDMRGSTRRAQDLGAKKTFLTMHVYFPSLLEVVKHNQGIVIDMMGDGLMVLWEGDAIVADGRNSVQCAGICGLDMLQICQRVINPIIQKHNLGSNVKVGVGVTFGSVIVTKIGVDRFYDVKAFGNCINIASHYANDVTDRVKVSREIKQRWPRSPQGARSFESVEGDEEAFYLV